MNTVNKRPQVGMVANLPDFAYVFLSAETKQSIDDSPMQARENKGKTMNRKAG